MIDFEVVNQTINELKTEYDNHYLELGKEVDTPEFDKLGNIQKCYGLIVARRIIVPLREFEFLENVNIENTITKEQLLAITLVYIDICNKYNIVGFIPNYCDVIHISEQHFHNVLNGNCNYSVEFNNVCISCFKSVQGRARLGILNKLSEDRTGVVVLANNEKSVGLEYAQKRTLEKVAIDNLNPAQLPTFSGLKLLE